VRKTTSLLAFNSVGGGLVALLCSNSFKHLYAPFTRKTVFCSFMLVQVCSLVECGSAKTAGEDMICGELLLTGSLCSENLFAFIALEIVYRGCQVRVASSSVSEDSSAFGTLTSKQSSRLVANSYTFRKPHEILRSKGIHL
jgi:hypothetical protein